jgi:CBS domain-containing protein
VDFQLSLESEHVGSAYPKRPLASTADSTVGEVFQLFRAQRTGAVMVCDGSKLVGVFTERDALRLMAEGADLSTPLRDVMSGSPATVSSDTTVGEAIRKMSEGGYRHLPIVDSANKPVGMVDVKGIVHYLVEHFPDAVYNLPPNPNRSPSEREGA